MTEPDPQLREWLTAHNVASVREAQGLLRWQEDPLYSTAETGAYYYECFLIDPNDGEWMVHFIEGQKNAVLVGEDGVFSSRAEAKAACQAHLDALRESAESPTIAVDQLPLPI